jgi:hypothetical protein
MVIAKINFELNGVSYIKGDEIQIKDINVIRKLNENGYIEPLKYEDLVLIERQIKKEEEL